MIHKVKKHGADIARTVSFCGFEKQNRKITLFLLCISVVKTINNEYYIDSYRCSRKSLHN